MLQRLVSVLVATVTFSTLAVLFPKNLFATDSLSLLSTLPSYVSDFSIAGNYLYVAKGFDLNVHDLTDPTNPSLMGNFHDSCNFASIDVQEEEGYLTQVQMWCSPNPDNFSLFDLSDPTNPSRIGESLYIGGIGSSNKVVGDGDYAYILHAYTGLVIVDVRDPSDLKIVGSFNPGGVNFVDIELQGNNAFITDTENPKLWVLDISDKTNPHSIGEPLSLPPSVAGIDISDNYVYLASGIYGFTIIDKTDISDLKIIKSYRQQYQVRDVDVVGNFAFLANEEAGVTVLDISDPNDAKSVTTFDTPERVWQIKVYGNLVFANDPGVGLYILRFSGLVAADVEPFLDLPWDYRAKGMSFDDAATSYRSYFDHRYPLLSSGVALPEPADDKNKVTTHNGLTSSSLSYSTHDGYDYGKKAGTKSGEPQLAAASGTATYLGTCGACGNAILIDHGNGYQTRYYHLQKDDLIVSEASKSAKVVRGQKIGKVGFSGRVIPAGELGSHIHFMVVQDKNNDGKFDDNIPDGLVDPFGWQGSDPDPWPLYNFTYKGKDRIGNISKYLWTTPLGKKNGEVNSQNTAFDLGRYFLDFDLGNDKTYKIEMQNAPNNNTNDLFRPFGSSLLVSLTNENGDEITSLEEALTLRVDFSNFSLDEVDPNTLSIFSSSDGINWTREETLIDLTNHTATAQINHLSYFSLMAQRLDTTAPVTEIKLIGDGGEKNYFRSNVEVSFVTNDDGLGVDYSLYKLDDKDWEQYSGPFEIINEGKHAIEYYSVDKDENIESVKFVEFYIDKTAPEINFFYSKVLLDTKLEGIDENGVAVNDLTSDEVKVIDKAGNSTIIKGKFDLAAAVDMFSLTSISYNLGAEVKFPENSYRAEYKTYPDGKLISIAQNWQFINNLPNLVATNYRTNIESTRVRIKVGSIITTDSWLEGTHLLSIYSEKGNLKYSYE